MPAITVETKFHRAMEHAWIGAKMLCDGNDFAPVEERIDFVSTASKTRAATDRASVKKQARKERTER